MAKKKKPAGGNAIIYARYSSHNQRDVSIEQQIEACRKHAAELGLTITDTYEDRAISGRTDNRPAFQRMMHDAENGRFSYVLAWKSNRMGRNMMQAMVNESRLMDCGVKVYYAEEDFDDSAAGRFALRSMMNVNQFYSDNLAEDVRRGLMDNANKCMANGRQPLGYKRGEDGKVVVDEPAAAIVREVYARVASGELFTDIARDLNRRGIKTADKGEWNKNSFHRLCSNEKYRGIYIYGDVRIEGGIPTIIDDTLWYKVQEALRVKKLKRNGRHRPGDEDYLLTGKLRCGKCGGYMIGMSGRSKTGDIHYYYACQNRRVGRTCDKKNIRRDVIEPAVAQAIKEYCLTDDAIEWIADKTVEYWEKADRNLQLDSIEGDLAAVQSSISNVMKAIEMGVVTETTRDRLIELEKQRTDLKSKLALAKEEVVHVDRKKLISSLLLFRNGDIHDRQYQEDLFKTFLISVYVYDDDDNGHLKIVFNAFGDNNTVDLPIDFGETDNQSAFSDGAEKFDYSLHRSTRSHSVCIGWLFFYFVIQKQRTALPDGAPFYAVLQDADAACAVGILIVQQVARVIGQRAVGGGQVRQAFAIHAAKAHGVGGHDQIILCHIVLDELGTVEHGKAIAQIAQGVVHAGQRVGLALVQQDISTGGLIVDLHVLHARGAGGAADPDVLVVGLHGVGDIGVDLVGRTGHMQEATVLLAIRANEAGCKFQCVLDLLAGD